jgi:hypothetical protein
MRPLFSSARHNLSPFPTIIDHNINSITLNFLDEGGIMLILLLNNNYLIEGGIDHE